MLILDRRETDLEPILRRHDVEVVVSELEFGDLLFTGNGPDGECMVGVERKRLSDLVNSMKDRRLSGHQLAGLWRSVDYVFLFVESVFRPGPHGEIEELRDRDWRPFYSVGKGSGRQSLTHRSSLYLTSLELLGNVVVRRSPNMNATAAQYAALYSWFQKPWGKHHAHYSDLHKHSRERARDGLGTPHAHDEEFGKYGRGRAIVVGKPPSTCWRMASQLPGIDSRAEKVAEHFGSVRAMVEAGEKEWATIDGIGKITARAVVRAIREEGA